MTGVSSDSTPRPTAGRLAARAAQLFAGGSLTQRFRPYICPFEELLPIVPEGSSILDVGCGRGLFLGLLATEERIRSGVGFDSAARAIAEAQKMSRRAVALGAKATLVFQHRDVNDPWPDETFDVVSVIDVMHHVPPPAQRRVFELAVARLRSPGLLIYKDMVRAPVWRALANQLHDLVIARQWIHYAPIDLVEQWGREQGLSLVDVRSFNRYCYGHDLRVFKRG